MADLREMCADMKFAMFMGRGSMVGFRDLLENVTGTELKEFNHAELLTAFKSLRKMSDEAVVLLFQGGESVKLSNPDLNAIQEVFLLAAETIQLQSIALHQVSEAGFKIASMKASTRGKTAADALHGKAGGSREKSGEMRRLWATGNFASRDVCAEQECSAVGLSFSAARKALRNTPNPT